MNIHRFRHTVLDHDVESLQGYLELGLKRQSLALARRVLRRPQLTAAAFNEAVSAILIQVNRLEPWQPWVEAAYARLPVRSHELARFWMLSFCVAIKQWSRAEHHLPERSDHATEVLFTVWTLIALHRGAELRRFYRQLPASWRSGRIMSHNDWRGDEMELSAMAEALACYHAYAGHPHAAQRWWKLGTVLRPYDANAFEGLIKLSAGRALDVSQSAQEHFAEVDDDWELHEEFPFLFGPPKQPRKENSQVRRFRKFERQLTRVVPQSERFRFPASEL